MDVQTAVILLKSGSLPRVREWAETLNLRHDEALATLDDEGVEIESWFLFSRNDEDFLICYMRSEDIVRAQEAVTRSLHEIDAYHQQFKQDTWAKGQLTELLVDLDATLPRS